MTISNDEFTTFYTAAGGWFIITAFEQVYDWNKNQNFSKDTLIDNIFNLGFDTERTGSTTRVNALLRLIKGDAGKEALEKSRDSSRINNSHPNAYALADGLIQKYY